LGLVAVARRILHYPVNEKTQLLNLGCSARIVIEKFDNPKKALAPLSHHTHTYLDAELPIDPKKP
jgi:hypothetical protein